MITIQMGIENTRPHKHPFANEVFSFIIDNTSMLNLLFIKIRLISISYIHRVYTSIKGMFYRIYSIYVHKITFLYGDET